MPDHQIYSEEYKIRSSEVNPKGKVKLQSICDLLQETAGNHSLKLDFDISQLKDNNLTWVLHRLHVQMDHYPEWRDELTIKTWPSSGDTLRAYRDFQISNSKGKEIGRSLSYWLMMNTENRRPVRMPDEILQMAPSGIDHVLDIRQKRLRVDGELLTAKKFRVRRSDLDLNRHVNNVRYIEWALEVIPEGREVKEIDIEFRSECTLDQVIESRAGITGAGDKKTYSHQISRADDGQIAAVAKTRI